MKMIAHEALGVNLPIGFGTGLSQGFQKTLQRHTPRPNPQKRSANFQKYAKCDFEAKYLTTGLTAVNFVNMKSIALEDEVFAELNRYTNSIISHNDVIKKLLSAQADDTEPAPVVTSAQVPENGSLVAFIQSADYRMLTSGIKKYLAVLGWLHKVRQNDFQKVEDYRRGNRVYFAKTKEAVEKGGNGAIHAKQIPNSPVWTLATLDNRSKRIILTDLLRIFDFKADEINTVVSTIADSGRHRGSSPFTGIV